MGFHPERDRIAPTNVHNAGVLPNAGQDFFAHFLGHGFPEIPQVYFRRFIRTVLGPHDGIHGQFRVGGTTTKDLFNAGVFVVLEP